MNTMLFTPISIGPVELPNRIAVPPMAMYSARSGVVQLFHKMHYGHLAASGAGLVCIESTAVSPDGRISGPMSVNKGSRSSSTSCMRSNRNVG